MKILIEVANRKEADLLRRGLADPATRALVKVIGALLPLKSKEQQQRALALAAAAIEYDKQAAFDRKLDAAGWRR